LLAIHEREMAQVLVSMQEDVERHEHGRGSAIEKAVKLWLPFGVETHDLAVEHRGSYRAAQLL
jgi:hypothetical protein